MISPPSLKLLRTSVSSLAKNALFGIYRIRENHEKRILAGKTPPDRRGIGKTFAGNRGTQCLYRHHGRKDRIPRPLPVRCGRGERRLRTAGSRFDDHGRRAGGGAAHHRRYPAAPAGGLRHRLRREVGDRTHGQGDDQGRSGRDAPGGPDAGQALRAPPGQVGRTGGRNGGPDQGGRGRQERPRVS